MRWRENPVQTIWRYFFRGIGFVVLIGTIEAFALFMHAGCRWNSADREREERARAEAKRQYEQEREAAKKAGTDPNSAVRKLNSGKWLPEGKKASK